MAFLAIITRHLVTRPRMLQLNQLSLSLQTDRDYRQIVIPDETGQGIRQIDRLVLEHAPSIKDEYVMFLDDDDIMINAKGIELIKRATGHMPPAVIFRGWHNELGILPDDEHWDRRPVCGKIGSFDFAIRNDVFKAYVHAFLKGDPDDFSLIDAIYSKYQYEIAWLDTIICWAIRRSNGGPE